MRTNYLSLVSVLSSHTTNLQQIEVIFTKQNSKFITAIVYAFYGKMKQVMQIHYDSQCDLMYLRLDPTKQELSNTRLSVEIVLDVGNDDKIVGIEIRSASKHFNLKGLLPIELFKKLKLMKHTILFVLLTIKTIICIAQSDTLYLSKAQTETDPKRKIVFYSKSIELLDGQSMELKLAYFERGQEKAKLEDYYGAIDDLSNAVLVNATVTKLYVQTDIEFLANRYDQLAYVLLGDCYRLINMKEESCLAFSKAGEKGYSGAYDLIKHYCTDKK